MKEKISPEKAPRESPKTAILDCTLRDGGAMNASRFSDKTARAVYDACADAGIDYVEVGYKNSRRFFDPAVYGDWRFCDESALRRVFGENPRPIKIAVMADAGKSDYRAAIPRESESIVSLVRVATYARGLGEALDIVKHAADMGYETSVNLMATSSLSDAELDDAFGLCAESDAGIVYMMDSFGALTPRAFDNVFSRCLAAARGRGKRVGVHIHDNLQLAFANTISAIRGGADIVDGAIAGLGRGAGNCRTEMLAGHFSPRTDIRPILECAQNEIEPMREKLRWGFAGAYMLTGLFGAHPSKAMEFVRGENGKSLADFYDEFCPR